MKTSCFVQTLGVLALLGLSSQSFAQTTAASDPVGFVSVTVKANSDAAIALPLNRAAEFKGVIQSISGNTITVAGTSPAWTTNQFVQALPGQVKTYAVQLASGTKEGMIGKVTANGANTVTVQLSAGDDLSGVKTEAVDGVGQGDHIDIMPYWTPSSLFASAPPTGLLLQGFDSAGAGVNLGASELYAHAGSNLWEDGITSDDATHVPLRFGLAMIVRNPSGADLVISIAGAVPMAASRIRLATLAGSTPQDVAFGFMSPVPEALSTVGNPGVPVPNQSANVMGFPAQPGDSIIGFDNNASGINKGASEIYTWSGSAWEDDINGGEVPYTVSLKPGVGYVFRKAATPTPTSVVWSKLPSYLQ